MASGYRLLVCSDQVSTLGRLSFPLRFGENRFGRSNGLRLPSFTVSREHCSIFVFCNNVILLDYSRNGTLVSEQLVNCEDFELYHGDVISIGIFKFMLMRDPGIPTIDLSGSNENLCDSSEQSSESGTDSRSIPTIDLSGSTEDLGDSSTQSPESIV